MSASRCRMVHLLSLGLIASLLSFAAGCSHSEHRGGPIATAPLLDDLTDLHALARFPDPPYTCKQFSSYDRASNSPADQEKWFANGDVGQYLRVEDRDGRKEYVMADMDGPGAIVRIWSANPAGTLRVYLDGAAQPVIECLMAEFLGGGYRGIPKPLAGEYSKGWNTYFPIAYARHCKVTSDQGGFYYHVNYRTYPAGTAVTTYRPDDLRTAAWQIYDMASDLAWPAGPVQPRIDADRKVLAAGEALEGHLSGAKEITWLGARIAEGHPQAEELRRLVLRIRFDDESCVETPLGDFFSCTPALTPNESLPEQVRADGWMISRWHMPFARRAEIEIRNHGDHPVALEFGVATDSVPWTARSMHFHANWRQSVDLPSRPMIDWNYLTVKGEGVFVGAAFSIANPVRAWWGEGDEKIYVDGETFPSHFGTGTEDYYGYAWCWPVPFSHAYHNQPRCDGPGNYGHTSVNRWHILDRIPFLRDFKFDMELWHWDEKCKVTMSVVAFWYARPGATDGFAQIKPEDLKLVLVPKYEPWRAPGAIEGESLRILEKTAKLDPQGIDGCSGESHLWWHDGVKIGDKISLAFDAPEAGRYRVLARFMSAGDYGIHRISINGTATGEPRDFYNNGIKLTDEIALGEFALQAGENRLGVECVGTSPSSKGQLFGLDYIRLERLP